MAAEIVWSGAIGDVTEVARLHRHPALTRPACRNFRRKSPCPSHAGLGSLAGRRAPCVRSALLRAVQLARLSRFRHRPDRQLGHPHRGSGAHRAATGRARQRGMHLASKARAVSPIPHRAVIRLDFPARGDMPPVTVYYHDSARPGDPEAYRVPGHGERDDPAAVRTIWRTRAAPDGRTGRRRSVQAAARGSGRAGSRSPRAAARGSRVGARRCRGLRVFDPARRAAADAPQPGMLTGNGRSSSAPRASWPPATAAKASSCCPRRDGRKYVLPPQLLTRSPGHMLDWVRACKGGDPSCSDFSITAPFAEWLTLGVHRLPRPRQARVGQQEPAFHQQRRGQQYVKPVFRKGWELKL